MNKRSMKSKIQKQENSLLLGTRTKFVMQTHFHKKEIVWQGQTQLIQISFQFTISSLCFTIY